MSKRAGYLGVRTAPTFPQQGEARRAGMGFVDHIASKMAFFPPQPATYAIKRHTDNGDLYISPKLP